VTATASAGDERPSVAGTTDGTSVELVGLHSPARRWSMTTKVRGAAALVVMTLSFPLAASASDSPFEDFDPSLTYGSVEAIPNPAVVDTQALRSQSLAVHEAFVERVLECGFVDRVLDALTDADSISTIDEDNSAFAVGAGGFAGRTTASIVYTVVDSGADAATQSDVAVLTNSLGYVFSQGSAFLLDADDPESFDFAANYAVLLFDATPPIEESAALFETVGDIDPDLFSTNTSGYTQYGPAYLTLQSAVSDAQFIAGYVAAAAEYGVEYTPIVAGEPSLYEGGAAFPDNDWRTDRQGESYLRRIPAQSHEELEDIRDAHLRVIDHAQRVIQRGRDRGRSENGLLQSVGHLPCRL
jgi:hypothetical protein